MPRRFHPPRLRWSSDLEWLLVRAYGPVGLEVPAGNPEERGRLAGRTALGRRVANRQPRETLLRELGAPAVERLSQGLRQQVARGLAVLEAERLCSKIATERQLPGVLLKFAAMQRLGVVNLATRGSTDLDLLINERDVAAWSRAMEGEGALCVEHWVPGHHPAVYCVPACVNVEFHVCLPYLRTKLGETSVVLEGMRKSDQLLPAAEGASPLYLPRRPILAAHLIAHGLVQHGFAPAAYPVLRVLSDLIDLDFGGEEAKLSDVSCWLCGDLGAEELEGLVELVGLCRQGIREGILVINSPAERILSHLLACSLDDRYRAWLRVRRLGQVVEEQGLWGTVKHLARAVGRKH